jgi:sn-glycerol 3-phosphate transport system permease protein
MFNEAEWMCSDLEKSSAMFRPRWMSLALTAPQLLIVFLYFFWPA